MSYNFSGASNSLSLEDHLSDEEYLDAEYLDDEYLDDEFLTEAVGIGTEDVSKRNYLDGYSDGTYILESDGGDFLKFFKVTHRNVA